MSSLSVIISTKDHAKIVERALKSVEFADEIIVVDMFSEDETLEIVKKYTDQIYQHQDYGYVEPVRNFSLDKASGDWILILDADEEVSPGLRKALKSIAEAEDQADLPDCFYLPRKNIIFGHWLQSSGWWPDYQLRFFRQGYVEWSEQIHSVPITRGEVKEFPPQEKFALIHHNYQAIDQFIKRLNRYTSIQAKERDEESLKLPAQQTVKVFKDEFFRRFFMEKGFSDLPHGLAVSFLQAVSEAVAVLKLWEKQDFARSQDENDQLAIERTQAVLKELTNFKRELAYWLADTQFNQASGLTKLYWRLRRKLAS